jgi:predicted nucleic acid-binding protein
VDGERRRLFAFYVGLMIYYQFYDVCYLESANRLRLPLLTFDGNMAEIGKGLGITILGGNDAGI